MSPWSDPIQAIVGGVPTPLSASYLSSLIDPTDDIQFIDLNQSQGVAQLLACFIHEASFIVLNPNWPTDYQTQYIASICHVPRDAHPVCLIATSGTSGDPSLCCHRISSLFVAAQRALSRRPNHHSVGMLLSLSPSKMGGLMTIVTSLVARVPLIVPNGHWRNDMAFPHPMHVTIVPQQIPTLAAHLPLDHAIQSILIGGDALTPSHRDTLSHMGIAYSYSYGLTETAGQVVSTPFSTAPHSPTPLPGVTIHESDDHRLHIGVDTLALGYATHNGFTPLNCDHEGRYITNDRGIVSPFQILGRVNRQFQSGAALISPEVIESVLLDTHYVEHVTVVPQPHDRYGYVPVAYIHPADNVSDLSHAVRDQLPIDWQPKAYYPWPKDLDMADPHRQKKLAKRALSMPPD